MGEADAGGERGVLQARAFNIVSYKAVWQAMRLFTDSRTVGTKDEVWVLEHFPIFTIGHSRDRKHLHDSMGAVVIKTDRGGDVTFHGPGQVVMYCLLDLKRNSISIRQLVHALEEGVVKLLATWDIHGVRKIGAPGIYVDNAKIASLGLRVRRGCSYHGLSFNLTMDLSPFSRIDPCGYVGLPVTSVQKLLGPGISVAEQKEAVITCLPSIFGKELNYSHIQWKKELPRSLGASLLG